jgi:hypothetical protein
MQYNKSHLKKKNKNKIQKLITQNIFVTFFEQLDKSNRIKIIEFKQKI